MRGPGATAPSIVDSIGGSFVLHSPGVVDQNHYDLSVSTDPYGGIVANALAAVRWKKLSAVVTYGVNDSPGPLSTAGIVPSTSYNIITTVNGNSYGAYSPPTCTPPGCQDGSSLIAPGYSSACPFLLSVIRKVCSLEVRIEYRLDAVKWLSGVTLWVLAECERGSILCWRKLEDGCAGTVRDI